MTMRYEMEELVPIVGELVRKYTSNESTSVTYEKAQQLMKAVLFCIREGEITEACQTEDGETLVDVIKDSNLSASEAYDNGYQCVLSKTKAALSLYHRIMEGFHSYGNIALYDTIEKGIPEFFRHYDARFAPQNQILTLDYPTLVGVEKENGIDVIYQYLEYVELEQRFLAEFAEEYVATCLQNYHEDYKELLINLPSIVLRETITKMLGDEYDATIQKDREEIEQIFCGNLRTLIGRRYANDERMFEYFKIDCREWSYWVKASQ